MTRLHAAGVGTLLFDRLTPAEQRTDEITRELRFDVSLLESRRLAVARRWRTTTGSRLGAHISAPARALRQGTRVVADATHLFSEPGTLDDVCDHASAWLDRHCPCIAARRAVSDHSQKE